MEDRIVDYLEIAGLLVALASAIAAATPSESDNRVVAALIRVLDAFALNWGKRNPRKLRDSNRTVGKGSHLPAALLMLLPLLGGCKPIEGVREPQQGLLGEADSSRLHRAAVAYKGAGIDPLRFDEEQLHYWDLVCVTALLVDAEPQIIEDCAFVREALASDGR